VEWERNSPDKAEADLKTAMTNSPKSPQPYLMLGDIRFRQKRYAEAVPLLEQALQYDPNSVGALSDLVTSDLLQKQPSRALDRVNAQIAKSPRNSEFYDLLAELQIQNKNFDQATATVRKAMEINQDDGKAISIYAQLMVNSGQSANAIGAWEQWTKAHPGNAGGFAILGTLEESRGNSQKAEEYYKKALQIQPDEFVANNNLACLMLKNGENVDVALTLAQTARRTRQDSPNVADTLAWAYFYKGTYAFARDLLEDATKKEPNSATMQYHLGMVYSKLRDKSNAALHLKKAISLDPKSQAAKDAQAALAGLG
jgi:predicted Zn-dependent protease